MNQQRALLDDILGYNRDRIKKRTFEEINNEEICKYMLAGCCLFTILKSIKYKYKECTFKNHDKSIKKLFEESDCPNLIENEKLLYKNLIIFYEQFILNNKNEEKRIFSESKDKIKQFYFELKKEESFSKIEEKVVKNFDLNLKKYSFELENLFSDFLKYKNQSELLNEYFMCECGKVLKKNMEIMYKKAHINSKYHIKIVEIFCKLEELFYKFKKII